MLHRMLRYINFENVEHWIFDDARLIQVIIPIAFFVCGVGKIVGNICYVNLSPTSPCMTGSLPPLPVMLYIALPTPLFLLASLVMDLYSWYLSKTNNLDTQMPKRASIISSSLAVATVIVGFLLKIDEADILILSFIGVNIIATAVKNPLTVAFGFPVNEMNEAPGLTAEEQKTVNQQIEEEYAIQRRTEVRAAREGTFLQN